MVTLQDERVTVQFTFQHCICCNFCLNNITNRFYSGFQKRFCHIITLTLTVYLKKTKNHKHAKQKVKM